MLNLFGSEKVPGVEHAQLYRSDTEPHKWYIVTDRVGIARDDAGEPLISFILYARDLDRLGPEDAEIERGWLGLTTQVAVTPEEEKKILTHLRAKLQQEKANGSSFLRLLGLPLSTLELEPEISYAPEFVSGTAMFTLLDSDLVPKVYGTGHPSLLGTNVASFAASLPQDGAELLRQALQTGGVPALVEYKDLTFLARIPAIEITITGDRHDFFNEIVTHYFSSHSESRNVDYCGWFRYQYTQYWSTSITTLQQFRSQFQSVQIVINDQEFRNDPAAAAVSKQLEDLALELFKDTVMPSMFDAMAAIPEEQRKTVSSVSQQLHGTISINLKRSAVIQKPYSPNSVLRSVLKPTELARATTYLDLGQPMFSELAVGVHANVNFKDDPVFGLKVFLDYDQKDDLRNVRVKKSKEFLIKNADTVHRFRVPMAKGADGAPKDTYRLWSKLVYRETGEEVRVPPGDGAAIESRDREQVISYQRLGFRRVALALGLIPDTIRSVEVWMKQPGATAPSAEQTFELTRDRPSAVFFTHTGKEQPEPYQYRLTYLLAGNQRMDLQPETSQSELLTVGDPFELTLRTPFIVAGDFSVIEKLIVDAKYQDQGSDLLVTHHAELVSNGEASEWEVGVRDPDRLGFEYTVQVLFKGGAKQTQKSRPGTLGQTVFVGGGVDALEVMLVPNFDPAVYRLALVEMLYDDGDGTRRQQQFRLTADETDDLTFRVLLQDAAKRGYRYRIRLLGVDPGVSADSGWQDGQDTFLVVQWPL
jgi:hypothetical protein